MGSDDLFKKRKAKKLEDLERKAQARKGFDTVLIVCEGEKSEPNYFEEIKEEERLSDSNVKVVRNCGSAPISVVKKAISTFNEEPIYDSVFCVFDRDNHETYDEAKELVLKYKLKQSNGDKVRFEVIYSNPCFEYWILLHFGYTKKPYRQVMGGTRSISDLVIDDLIKYLPDYKKNTTGLFLETREMLDNAIGYSKKILEDVKNIGEENPSTNMHVLVEYLIKLKKPKDKS